MSEFDEALAQAVQDGIAHGGLPGAADAVRRGRRRSLRARGGVTVLGVAVVAGALGGAGMFGGGAGAAGAASGAAGHASDGILPAAQWPGYDVEHWTVSPSGCSAADRSKCHPGQADDPNVTDIKVTDWFGLCTPGPTYPVRRFAHYATQYDAVRKLDADEIVVTLADEHAAAAFMADIRAASPGKACAGVSGVHLSPGVSTADGVSRRTVSEPQPGFADYGRDYAVRQGDRVALLRVNEDGQDTVLSATDDATVLHDLAVALDD